MSCGINPQGSHLRGIEARVSSDDTRDLVADMAQAIRARYETAPPEEKRHPAHDSSAVPVGANMN